MGAKIPFMKGICIQGGVRNAKPVCLPLPDWKSPNAPTIK